MTRRSPKVYLYDIVTSIDELREAIEGVSYERFTSERRLRWSIERGIEIISEASRRVPEAIKERHPAIPWHRVAAIGNVLRHEYDHVAPAVIWNVVRTDLDDLATVCRAELDAELARERHGES